MEASPQVFPRPLPHHHFCRPREEPSVQPPALAYPLMKRPSWCTASFSHCEIWSSVYQAGTSLSPPPQIPFGTGKPISVSCDVLLIVFIVHMAQGRVVCQLPHVDVQAAPLRNGLGLSLRHVERPQFRVVALRYALHLHRPIPRICCSESPCSHGLACARSRQRVPPGEC